MPRLSCLCVLIVLIAFSIRAQCSEPPIIVGNTQMNCGDQQVLSIWNYQKGNTYTWSIQSGGGSLSASSGERVTYTAPYENPYCANNPTIVVSRNGEAVGSIVISINCHTGSEDDRAYICYSDFLSGKANACCAWDAVDAVCVRGDAYNCFGAKIEAGHYGCVHFASCKKTYTHLGIKWNCVNHDFAQTLYDSYEECISSCILYYTAPNTCTDIRTEVLKQQGCCPPPPPPPPIPEDIKPDPDEPECDPASVSDPISIYDGNATESEEDFRFASPNRRGFFIKRLYNSEPNWNRRLGYGWSHTYTVGLNPSYEFEGTVYLRIVDETGRGVYFEETASGHYTGAFKERTTVEVEEGNYVWYRLDGSRFAFNDPQGRLIWIEDELGNRQNLTYYDGYRLETVTDEASGRVLSFHYNADNLLDYISGPVTAAVPDGIWVSFGYDANQNLVSVTYADGSGFDYIYGDPNDVHNLTEKHDKMGHLLSTWTYDAQDRAFESFTRDGQGVTINYVDENKVLVTDAYGVTRTYTIWKVDGHWRVTDTEGPPDCPGCGQDMVRLEYNSAMRIIEVEYADGSIKQYDDFDSQGNAQTVRLAVGTPDERTITYTFHPDTGAKLSETEPSVLGGGNKVTIWDYDDDGNTTPNENPTRLLHRKIEQGFTKEISGSVTSYEHITTYTYNSKGQVLTIDGPEPGTQDTTTFTYDGTTGDLLTVTRPVVGTTTYSQYDAAGQGGRVTDANGNALTYTYDGRSRTATMTNEVDGSTTAYDYNNAGELETVTQPNGVTSDFVYDVTSGRLTRITDPLGNYIQYGYDDQGNRTELSHFDPQDQRLFWKRFDFQGPTHPGRLWKEINPDDTYTEYTYDAGGNISSVTDAAEKTTSYHYDLFDRLTTVTQPGSVITGYAYDQQNNLTTVTDAEGHVTTYVYDDLGRLVTTTSPDTGTTAYAYDASGNLIAKTDANGQTATYTYDDLNRLTGVRFPDSAQDITYTYDQGVNGKGRLTGMTDPSGTYAYGYDALGRLITEEKTIDTVTYTTQYDYDEAGVLTGIAYPDGRTVTYELDSAARVNRVTTTKESVTSTLAENITYLPFGPLMDLTYGNGTALTRTFDELYRLKSLGAAGIQNLGYDLDPVGNITTITDNLDPARSQSFGYDDLYRLTSATGVYGAIGYTYDNVGNRRTKTIGVETDTYSYELGSNRLAEITGANPSIFSYDSNGNITAINDSQVQLPENPSLLADYLYNGNGQRIKKVAGENQIIYHYDRFGNLMAESTTAGVFVEQYIYLGNTRLAAIDGGANLYYYINDHLGTPQKMIDNTSAVVWSADYKPFGEADVTVNTVENNFRFPGQYYDGETGLHYNWHRYYDPGIGRYLRPDPYKGNISEPGTLYPYLFCLANPLINIDEQGLSCEPICVPFWWSSSKEILSSEKDTWLTGADVLCYYMTRQRDFVSKMTETKYICIYFKSKGCGKCDFDTVRIKTGRDWHEEWTGWRVIERFTARPVSRYMGHTGPVTVCPPRGPNYKGAIPSIIP
jgi:RHS repeat-associated protein